MMPVILLGMKILGSARFSLVSFWQPRRLAIAVSVASSSAGQAIILAFLAIKSFFTVFGFILTRHLVKKI
jgi:hypothetical protein